MLIRAFLKFNGDQWNFGLLWFELLNFHTISNSSVDFQKRNSFRTLKAARIDRLKLFGLLAWFHRIWSKAQKSSKNQKQKQPRDVCVRANNRLDFKWKKFRFEPGKFERLSKKDLFCELRSSHFWKCHTVKFTLWTSQCERQVCS